MKLQKVSTRKFRNKISQYLSGKEPIAVLRHGQTIGYYFPANPDADNREIETLKLAAQRLDTLLKSKGVTEDELVEEFQKMRKEERAKGREPN